MSRTLLSFVIAGAFVLSVFIGNQILRGADHGVAEAAFPDAVDGDEVTAVTARKRGLRYRIVEDSDVILGLKGQEVFQLFQEPELVRRDLPTVVWQYRTNVCVLDVYFTAARDDVLKSNVAHYELRSRLEHRQKDAAAVDVEDCLGDLAQGGKRISLLNPGAFYKSAAR